MRLSALGWLAPAVVAAIWVSRGIVLSLRHMNEAAEREAVERTNRDMLHGPDWLEDQPVGVTKDGTHDKVRLSMCERITLEQLEREYERGAR